jgi:hypothetical protein
MPRLALITLLAVSFSLVAVGANAGFIDQIQKTHGGTKSNFDPDPNIIRELMQANKKKRLEQKRKQQSEKDIKADIRNRENIERRVHENLNKAAESLKQVTDAACIDCR